MQASINHNQDGIISELTNNKNIVNELVETLENEYEQKMKLLSDEILEETSANTKKEIDSLKQLLRPETRQQIISVEESILKQLNLQVKNNRDEVRLDFDSLKHTLSRCLEIPGQVDVGLSDGSKDRGNTSSRLGTYLNNHINHLKVDLRTIENRLNEFKILQNTKLDEMAPKVIQNSDLIHQN